jgi:16S rRNA (uracil1498-N3)-methyltransferase
VVLDGGGKAFQVELTDMGGEYVIGKVTGTGEAKNKAAHWMQLFFPLTKKQKVEWILQKGTEVGVSSFQPFICRRSLIQSTEIKSSRIERWEAIIREAAEQSGRTILPELNSPIAMRDIKQDTFETMDGVFVACVGEYELPLKDALEIFRQSLEKKSDLKIALMIGPEGGFTPEEVDNLKNLDCTTVSLGKHVLRMETAAILMPAMVSYTLG